MQHPNDVIRFSDAATNICRSYLTRRLRKSRGLMHSCQPNLRDNRMTSLGSLRRRQAQGPTTSLSHNPNIPPAAFPVSKSVKEREEGGGKGKAVWQNGKADITQRLPVVILTAQTRLYYYEVDRQAVVGVSGRRERKDEDPTPHPPRAPAERFIRSIVCGACSRR